jgi:hypothetical protein
MISPFTATFYADILKDGRKERIEFDVIDDQAKLGEVELGLWIKKTIDVINRRRIAPYGARQGRYGVYRTFEHLWKARWFRFDKVLKYGFDRNYVRMEGTGIPSG